MMFDANNPQTGRRVWVFRLSSGSSGQSKAPAGWLARLLVPAALIALIPVALIAVVGLWAVVAVGATVMAAAVVVGGPLLRRLRATPAGPTPAQGHILEGEAKRIEGD
jgi:hypothetical protein